MKSNEVYGGATLPLILLVPQAVALATNNLFVLKYEKITLEVGLFADGPLFSYIAFVGLYLLGCFFNFLSLIICIAHAVSSNPRPKRPLIRRLCVMWMFSSGYHGAGVIWICLSLMTIDLTGVDWTLSVYPGYGFYLGCISGVFYLIAVFLIVIVISRRPVSAIMTACVVPRGAPHVFVIQSEYSGYPPVGPTGFPNVENMGYPQNDSTGYPTNTSNGLPEAHPSYGYDQV